MTFVCSMRIRNDGIRSYAYKSLNGGFCNRVPSLTWNSFKGAHNFLLCPASAVNEVKRAEKGVQFFIYVIPTIPTI